MAKGWPKGVPRPVGAGRKKGVPNKRTWEARALADRLGVDPLELALLFAKGDWKALGYDGPTKTVVTADGQRVQVDRIDEQLRSQNAQRAIPYLYPQLKSLELTGDAAKNSALSFASMVAALVKTENADKEESKATDDAPDAPGSTSQS